MRQPLSALIVALLLTACAGPDQTPAPTPPPTPPPGVGGIIPGAPTGPEIEAPPVTATDEDGAFRLELRAGQERYRAGQPIEVEATLTYLGPDDEIVALGSGSGLVGFGVTSREPTIVLGPAFTSDCSPHPMTRDEPMTIPFTKSGGYSPDEPFADFFEAYFADPLLRLPDGDWTIGAGGSFYSGDDCGDRLHELSASVKITVEP